MARNFNVGDAALTATIRDGQAAIFSEDVGILEAQQRNLSEQPSRHLMRLNIDMGGFEARRILERLVAEEQNDLLRADPRPALLVDLDDLHAGETVPAHASHPSSARGSSRHAHC